ncbi:uncharacterized protein LOC141680383 [Apium graveolens]|uniref:uncharacterized protein LOC141680383 n=1 Tax=Apium graveolens TaxID=4045 RepID=UPI003D79B375
MRASRNGQTSQCIIRKLVDTHTCDLELRFKDQRQATATVIADIIKNKYTNIKTKYTVADIIRDMNHDYKVQVKYGKAWRSKEKAGSNVSFKVGDDGCFLYVFVALNASMKGWPHCIPVVIVDGTFLKLAHSGTLLVAATQDAGGKIFPLAFVVVNSENDDSWDWFFDKFRHAYGLRGDMTIISDRHENIIKVVSKVYPKIPHGFCIFHLLSNIKSKFKKNLKNVNESFFSAANTYTIKKFEYHMRELDKVDSRIRTFLEEVGHDKWARVHSPNNSNSRTPNLYYAREFACFDQKVHPTNDVLFEVHNDDRKAIVDIGLRTCKCNRFQLDQLPCAHAIAVLQKANHDPYDYCSPYFTKEVMIHAYEETVFPVSHEDTWEVPKNIKSMALYPLQGRVRVGKPKKRRYKASWEMNAK